MRRAFVMGSNGPDNLGPLRYARKDAQSIRRCLSRAKCGFVVEMPQLGADSWDVRRQISRVASSCTSNDTFVCYFSGHGILEKGALFLLWDNTERDRLLDSAIPVSDILQVLKHCRAHSKLLILDCCHAGTVVHMVGLKDTVGMPVEEMEVKPDNHLILMASDRFEKARELESLKGSFLTTNICAALTDKFAEADRDKDNHISIHDLTQWLEDRARQHNSRFPDHTVPHPYLFGQQKGNFFLTSGDFDWVPYEIPWPDGSQMVVLPIPPVFGITLGIGKHPVTNAQYQKYVEEGKGREPRSEQFVQTDRQGKPLYPWRDNRFKSLDKPVVCVSYDDALSYCVWINYKMQSLNRKSYYTMLPPPILWSVAALWTEFKARTPDFQHYLFPLSNSWRDPHFLPHSWLPLHRLPSEPVSIDLSRNRSNVLGISDMFGNIWEWCLGEVNSSDIVLDMNHEARFQHEIDALERNRPLKSAIMKSYSNLGFHHRTLFFY